MHNLVPQTGGLTARARNFVISCWEALVCILSCFGTTVCVLTHLETIVHISLVYKWVPIVFSTEKSYVIDFYLM